jgi:pimeloyl-ACP methyl ester carboxylesterase
VGGDHSFGGQMAAIARLVATDVAEAVMTDSGHWLMEENPDATVACIHKFNP